MKIIVMLYFILFKRDDMTVDFCGLDVDQGGFSATGFGCSCWQVFVSVGRPAKCVRECDLDKADWILPIEYGQYQKLVKVYPHKKEDIQLLRHFNPFSYFLFFNIDG